METEKIVLSGSPIEIAEYEDHRMATFLISVLDEFDLNHRMIPKESGELYHSSMIGFPILAKMVCNEAGDPVDFAGHEMYIVLDENGNQQVRFNTHPIGSVVESWIEEREVAGYTGKKFCIMIKAKLWSTRYPEYFAVLDKLWAAHNVKSSWELTVQEAVQTAQGRILKAFSFIGNTLLGSNVAGAVPGAGVYEYAQADPEVELAAALSRDVFASKEGPRKEDKILDNTEKELEQTVTDTAGAGTQAEPVQDTAAAGEENATDPAGKVDGAAAGSDSSAAGTPDGTADTPDAAMLTSIDLRQRIAQAYRNANPRSYAYVAFWFPADNQAWMGCDDRVSELDYVRVTYTVENDEVVITSSEPVKLTVSIANVNDALASRDHAIAAANERINELTAQVSALQPYKDAADQAERERIEAETAEKRKAFREKMEASKLFTDDELETSEVLKAMIDSLDETALRAEIAERFMSKLEQDAGRTTETAQAAETTTKATRVQVAEEKVDNQTFMRLLLGKI